MTEIQFDPTEHPHRRLNLLTGEWVLVSPHRTKRPGRARWRRPRLMSGRPTIRPAISARATNVPAATTTPIHRHLRLRQRFCRLLPDGPRGEVESDDFFQMRAETGICRVICFSPRHDLTLPEMELPDIRKVVDLWSDQMVDLGVTLISTTCRSSRTKVQVMGCSNPHPHGQIWSNFSMPQEPAKEDVRQREYFEQTGSPLLVDYVQCGD
jgi:UDPglucose--hexose-1-phosphate uridylyltransferase